MDNLFFLKYVSIGLAIVSIILSVAYGHTKVFAFPKKNDKTKIFKLFPLMSVSLLGIYFLILNIIDKRQTKLAEQALKEAHMSLNNFQYEMSKTDSLTLTYTQALRQQRMKLDSIEKEAYELKTRQKQINYQINDFEKRSQYIGKNEVQDSLKYTSELLTKKIRFVDSLSHKSKAKRLELAGFDYLLKQNMDSAINAFSEAERIYPKYRAVYEIMRDLQYASKREYSWVEIYELMLDKYSEWIPIDIKVEYEEYILRRSRY